MGLYDALNGILPDNNPLDGGLQKFSPALYSTIYGQQQSPQPQTKQSPQPNEHNVTSKSGYQSHSAYEYIMNNPQIISSLAGSLGLKGQSQDFIKANIVGLLANPDTLEQVGAYLDSNFPVRLAQPDNSAVKLAQPTALPEVKLRTPSAPGKDTIY